MPIKLIDIEITEPLPSITDTDGCSAVWGLVRSEGTPIGMVWIDAGCGQITPRRLAVEVVGQCGEKLLRHRLYRHFIGRPEHWNTAAADPLAPSETTEEKRDLPFVSVLVCTRDRPESLRRTLDSLAQLDYPEFEVIVVDNCPSSEETAQLTAEYGFNYVLEPHPGLDWARNRGIAESRGEVVAFIDDDAVADPGWLRGLADGFTEPDAVCVTGLVLPSEMETKAQELFEVAYGGFCRGFERVVFRPGTMWKWDSYWPSRFGTGCNMAFRKEVFDRVGLFDVALDVGTAAGGGGDMDMFHRLVRAECPIVYSPGALVRHTHRSSDAELRKLLFNYGKSFTAFLTKCFVNEPDARLAILRFVGKWYRAWFVRRFLRRLRGREWMPVGLIAVEALGSIHGPSAYFRARKEAKRLCSAFASQEADACGC